ncbi:ribonucleoside triphosphate reductase [Aliarcobacter butzleri]|uniref:Ribonucleoside triphosphate reductase n=2 Tax=Aliarcobacter butzleri TaxID=28197 RepID=A0AAP4PNY3_9BACT|nr:ribonucleoside triphosphate reductase [Aliarcobacter butzleri]KLE06973.1 ribonucleoside triphosphate reductase [Aliarcobacter butzleri L353]MCT7538159.1 ribonucleoside triphosphate reductase [Aliarcobacter butzleri]MCT7549166.1 ribonucleoside triphosphate reductase [Aliarcobacter butzleri]MCT7552999.1 ribonucleoside triphosphate reductase [Aliarcobacter butzleri]MCT7553724.1 ribonucleoside triphosphate reductase [Aliarcobacter butzleri]
MIVDILKRDGSKQSFESYKIEDAIKKAFKSVNIKYDISVFFNVLFELKCKRVVAVEDIQDIIEKELYKARYFDVMKSFMIYRHLHKIQREQILQINKDTTYINSTQTIEEYINGSDWRIKANSNTGYSHAGLINNSAGKIIANYWLDKVYTKEQGYAHRNGDYHIHDLDCLSGYCAGWSLRILLDEGFNKVRGRVESNAPNHFREALGQMANFLGILQSEWAGAQAFSSFDTYLAPYVFKDKLEYKEIKKAIRSFIYNLNVPARWGQSPFTNITIDWTVPSDLKDQIPTRNQKHLFKDFYDEELFLEIQKKGLTSFEQLTYKDFQKEMNLINKAYYEIMTQGDKTGQPFTFPIPTVNITEDFDWYGENTDLLFENTAKIGSSYFQNFIGSQYTKDEKGNLIENEQAYKPGHVRSMCCRLQLDLRELLKRGGGLFGSAEMTGSIGVVTINMARLGYLYKGDIDSLLKRLEELMDLAKESLEIKREFINSMYERGLYPYTKRYLKSFNNHFSTIGVNGMNEMLKNFFYENVDISTKVGNKFCIEILDFMRNKMIKYQEETGNLYNLEATPAEGTTYRFAKEDKKRYKDIIQAGFDKNIYYTNSSQLPADFTDDPFEALELQDELQCKYTGGTVLHLYMREKVSSTEACRKFVKNVISNFRLPYITVTPVFSICEIHGYIDGEHEYCPKCDEEILKKELKDDKSRIA